MENWYLLKYWYFLFKTSHKVVYMLTQKLLTDVAAAAI